jgi:hypothetical protein
MLEGKMSKNFLKHCLSFRNSNIDAGILAHTCNPSFSGDGGRRMMSLRPTQAEDSETLSQKQNKSGRTGDIAQVVGYMPSKCEALGSIPHTTKKKKKTERNSNTKEVFSLSLGRITHILCHSNNHVLLMLITKCSGIILYLNGHIWKLFGSVFFKNMWV